MMGRSRLADRMAKETAVADKKINRLLENKDYSASCRLGLDPRPAGHNHNAWMANCPRTSHWLMISAEQNEFGCGYCRRKGGPAELRAFYETRYPRPG